LIKDHSHAQITINNIKILKAVSMGTTVVKAPQDYTDLGDAYEDDFLSFIPDKQEIEIRQIQDDIPRKRESVMAELDGLIINYPSLKPLSAEIQDFMDELSTADLQDITTLDSMLNDCDAIVQTLQDNECVRGDIVHKMEHLEQMINDEKEKLALRSTS
jgi:hypothetical protein